MTADSFVPKLRAHSQLLFNAIITEFTKVCQVRGTASCGTLVTFVPKLGDWPCSLMEELVSPNKPRLLQ